MTTDISKLEQQATALVAERDKLVDEYADAKGRAERDPLKYRGDFHALSQRLNVELPGEIDGVERALRQAREERASELARQWTGSREARALFQAAAEETAAGLRCIAALAASYEAAVRDGALVRELPPLPVRRIAELREFVAWVAALDAAGVQINASRFPEPVAQYVEGAR